MPHARAPYRAFHPEQHAVVDLAAADFHERESEYLSKSVNPIECRASTNKQGEG
jgi:hypothetical protein